jgi:hypothetical protein
MKTAQIPVQVPQLHIRYDAPRSTPENLPRLHFLSAIIGSRGSGKTTALVRMLKAYFRHHSFDKLYLYCPTIKSDPKYGALTRSAERHKLKVTVHETFSESLFDAAVEEIESDLEEYRAEQKYAKVYNHWASKGPDNMSIDDLDMLEREDYSPPPKSKWKYGTPTTLLIFDDLVGNRDLYRSDAKGPVASFAIRHRHQHTSMIFLTQTYHNGVPRQLRSNLSLLILFANKNDALRKEIALEFSSFVPWQRFLEMWEHATGGAKHSFFLVDFDASDPSLRFRRGFDQIFLSQ